MRGRAGTPPTGPPDPRPPPTLPYLPGLCLQYPKSQQVNIYNTSRHIYVSPSTSCFLLTYIVLSRAQGPRRSRQCFQPVAAIFPALGRGCHIWQGSGLVYRSMRHTITPSFAQPRPTHGRLIRHYLSIPSSVLK